MKSKTIAEITAAGRALEDFAAKQPVGTLVTYDEWDRVAILDVRKHRSILLGAFRRLQKRSGAVWQVVQGEGYRRVNDSGKLAAAEQKHKRSVREARRGLAVLVTVEDVAALPEREQSRYHGLGNRLVVQIAVGASRSKALDHQASEEFTARAALKAITSVVK